MCKTFIITGFLYFSSLIASNRVLYSDLYNDQGIWYSIHTYSSFNGTAYKLSNDSSIVIQQTNYINGIEWGKYYEWWPNGNKKTDGTYKAGLMHGRWKFFNENGKIYCSGSYINGGGHKPPQLLTNVPKDGIRGLWTYWDKNGKKIEEGYYSINGIAKGNWSFWDKNGRKRLGKKIKYEKFIKKDVIKHLDGYFLVSGKEDTLNGIYSQAYGSIRKGLLNGLWTYWDNKGNLLESRNYYNGILSGAFSSYHISGHKLSSGRVIGSNNNGDIIMDGKWSFWNEDGLLIEEVEYSNGLRNGITKYLSADGKQSAEILYQKGIPWKGKWISWYSNGIEKEVGNYDNGNKVGSWIGRYKNGQKKYVVYYKNNMMHGVLTEWTEDGRLTKDATYDNGTPVSEYLIIYHGDGYTEMNRRNGKLSGSWINWYSNGNKNEEGIYKNGHRSGVWNGWFRNGQKKYSSKYVNDKLNGLYKEMDINGNIIKEIVYTNGLITSESHTLRNDKSTIKFQKKDGNLNGKWVDTYRNGNIAEIGNYTQNKRDGKWEGWYNTGAKKYECNYIHGNKSGLYQEWDMKGKITKNITYNSGHRIKEYEVVKDGNGFMEINKIQGFLDGKWIRWYAEGLKREEGEYSEGTKVGTWSRYNINGQIIEEINYDNKGRNLYEITYYNNGVVREYKDYFSKTVQEYNIDGSKKGEISPF